MLLGIGLFSAVTAIVTSYLLSGSNMEKSDPFTAIERLAALARDGAITRTEYESKRDELLARI